MILEWVIIVLLTAAAATGWISYAVKPVMVNQTEITSQVSIQNQGQATIVDQRRMQGVKFTVTNVQNAREFLETLDDWQRREAKFDGSTVVFPEVAQFSRTNATVITNRTNWTE